MNIGFHYVAVGPDSTGLVGYWPLNEGAGTLIGDMSVNGNAGTLLNGPAWISGPAGRAALSFDGFNDYVSVADAPALRLGNQMTVAFWFRKNAEKSDWVRLVGKGDSNNRNYGVWEEPGAGKRILFQCFPATGSMINFYSTVNTEVGVWYHVACTYDGTTAKIYINGSPAGQQTVICLPRTSVHPLTFGYAGFYTYLSGGLDDVQIYARALDASEIAALATLSSRDQDGDGIPDYLEDADGDNDPADVTEGRETSPVLAQTTGGTADSVSTIYDDIDLSGSGLVGRIKKALGLSAFDTSNPLSLTQITTGHEPDIVGFKVGRQVGGQFAALDYDLLTSIGVLNLNLDGFDVTLQNCARATSGNGAVSQWNTTYEPPGQHFLQARLTLNGIGARNARLSGLGGIVPFYSDNVCRFFECDALYDADGAYLDAQLPVPNATYSIRLYDPSTTPPTLLKTIPTTSTSDGMIQEDWVNLICDQGPSPFAGSAFDAVFDITLLAEDGSTPIAHGTPTKRHVTTQQFNGFAVDYIDVAYMSTPADSRLAAEFSSPYGIVWLGMQGVVDTLTQPVLPWPPPSTWYGSSFNRYTSPVPPSAYPGYVGSMGAVVSLVVSLSDGLTKNFYCYSHGSPNRLENHAGDVKITAGVVAAALGNTGVPEFPYVTYVNNPYRFVFLDACDTAVDHQWRHAFGISRMGPDNQAARPILGPQAFVGWDGPVVGWLDGPEVSGAETLQQSQAVQSAYMTTLNFFFFEWMNGTPLVWCLKDATDPNKVPCPMPTPKIETVTIGYPYISPPYLVANRGPEDKKLGTIRIYGHPGLTRGGLNSAVDAVRMFDAGDNRR